MQIKDSVFRHKSVLRKAHSGHSRPSGENGALFRRTEEGYTNILLIFGFALDTPLQQCSNKFGIVFGLFVSLGAGS